ncbi:hypothetical protein KP509_10G072300 [Ceratopteris richardii]|uniref:Pectinesterase n=1 Tax=Ceratopteris richardii TaxID=49495 RepID=A0A8T2U090_CERRI|nr:hypothetical protein KP509_10G072300 [Ceratopteris richardii]
MNVHSSLVLLWCICSAALQQSCAKVNTDYENELRNHFSNFTWASSLLNKGRKLLPSYNQEAIISRYITVDKHGKGQYTRIQDAVDSIPEKNTKWVYIQINAGYYTEKVIIPYNKPYIIFQGAGKSSTIISWSERASDSSTSDSATFSVYADSFVARGIGFKNAAPPAPPGANGGQAVAVLLSGDMMAFYKCGFYGAQDTLFDGLGRHYFKSCYIEGSIDFIFGQGQSTYKECELYVKAQEGYISGSITAQKRDDTHDSGGFVFVSCTIGGTGQVYLGRAWGAYSRVVFMYTYMSSIIAPEGWSDWGIPSRRSILRAIQVLWTWSRYLKESSLVSYAV